jgi:hypothetical protein
MGNQSVEYGNWEILTCPKNRDASSNCPVASGTKTAPSQNARPTANPPAPDATNPRNVTPPFVPGFTTHDGLVIIRGDCLESTPSSLALIVNRKVSVGMCAQSHQGGTR